MNIGNAKNADTTLETPKTSKIENTHKTPQLWVSQPNQKTTPLAKTTPKTA